MTALMECITTLVFFFCHFASLVPLFHDAWKEGDGPRIIAYWKIFMLHFHASRETKYALEALRFQFQLQNTSPIPCTSINVGEIH